MFEDGVVKYLYIAIKIKDLNPQITPSYPQHHKPS